jgi:hypothetical protein
LVISSPGENTLELFAALVRQTSRDMLKKNLPRRMPTVSP